jgi:hypothetical protein
VTGTDHHKPLVQDNFNKPEATLADPHVHDSSLNASAAHVGHSAGEIPIEAGLLDMHNQGRPTTQVANPAAETTAGVNKPTGAGRRGRRATPLGAAVQQAGKCDKCNIPVANGGCKCDSNCDCATSGAYVRRSICILQPLKFKVPWQ